MKKGDKLLCKCCGHVYGYYYGDDQPNILVRCTKCQSCHFINLEDDSRMSKYQRDLRLRRRDEEFLSLYDMLVGKDRKHPIGYPYLDGAVEELFPYRSEILFRHKMVQLTPEQIRRRKENELYRMKQKRKDRSIPL